MFIAIVSLIFSQLHNPKLSKNAPPVMNQLSLCGLLPFQALKAPHYPLLHLNVVLFITMSTLNAIFMVKNKIQHLFILFIQLIFASLVSVYHR